MKKKFKRAVACIMAVCLLIVAVPPVQSNAAGFISPGMLFSFMSSLYGVYVQASHADNEMGAFETWLTKKVSDVKDNYSAAKEIIDAVKAGNMEKVTMSVALMTVAKEFFSERTADYGGISGGTAITISDSSMYMCGGYANSVVDQAFRNWVLSGNATNFDYSQNTILGFLTLSNGSSSSYIDVIYNTSDKSYERYFIVDGDTSNYFYLKMYDSNGINKGQTQSLSFAEYTYNPSDGSFTYSRSASSYFMYSDTSKLCSVIPVYKVPSSIYTSSNLNNILLNGTLLNGNVSEPIYTVTGGYQAGTIDKLADKELSAAQLQAIQDAVRTAVLDNTTTAEDDDTLVYSPDISIDLANAIVQALVDQGVITDETTGDDTATDPPLVVPTDPATFGIDLTKLFPFCIPFDLYDMLNVLCAEPTAPSFDWEIMSPTGKKEKFTIDLSVFDSVAQVVRTVELLGFCVGLAFKTRDLIRG